jgi:hypothetical protein
MNLSPHKINKTLEDINMTDIIVYKVYYNFECYHKTYNRMNALKSVSLKLS